MRTEIFTAIKIQNLASVIFTSSWSWSLQSPPKCWYPTTSLHDIKALKTTT